MISTIILAIPSGPWIPPAVSSIVHAAWAKEKSKSKYWLFTSSIKTSHKTDDRSPEQGRKSVTNVSWWNETRQGHDTSQKIVLCHWTETNQKQKETIWYKLKGLWYRRMAVKQGNKKTHNRPSYEAFSGNVLNWHNYCWGKKEWKTEHANQLISSTSSIRIMSDESHFLFKNMFSCLSSLIDFAI